MGSTHSAILSSSEYLSTAMRSFNNIEDGFCESAGLRFGVVGCVLGEGMDHSSQTSTMVVNKMVNKMVKKVATCMLAAANH